MNKKLIWGIVIVVVLIGSYIAYSSFSSSSRTSSWSEYVNPVGGYSLKHPTNWTVMSLAKGSVSIFNPNGTMKDGEDTLTETFTVAVLDKPVRCSKEDEVWTKKDAFFYYKSVCFAQKQNIKVEMNAIDEVGQKIQEEMLKTLTFK